MYLLMTGCEYAGKTTLAAQIMAWAERTIGATAHFHDHHTIPSTELSPEAQESLLGLHPQAQEMLQRFMIEYHISPNFYTKPDHNLMAPLYRGGGLRPALLRLRWRAERCAGA